MSMGDPEVISPGISSSHLICIMVMFIFEI